MIYSLNPLINTNNFFGNNALRFPVSVFDSIVGAALQQRILIVRIFSTALAIIFTIGSSLADAAGDIANGKDLYAQRCAACHSVDFNSVGPAHAGVFGRKAGTAPNYTYSAALKTSAVVWSDDTLAQWLEDPEKLIPGQKMWISVPTAGDRQDLIAYLKSLGKK